MVILQFLGLLHGMVPGAVIPGKLSQISETRKDGLIILEREV
jgi:hypothetical protein